MIVEFNNKEYKLDIDEIELEHAIVIKRHAGFTLKSLEEGLKDGDPDALQALYWLMLKQNGEDHNIARVSFKLVKFAKAIGEAQAVEAAEAALKRDAEEAGPKEVDGAAESE